ncbi:hypothetical protein GHT06_008838 [Daphnia sinensis]|uniref:Uncharacterized protein n=1 Tax=Daphnia sinensis TaxID=1820382 RepID=A0AAD5PLU5_9CRUS|nr:hypothetical protein GHT06_005564 [Daphnia sinensis]KAI9551107.1 hypothetical protein GHT06_005567 [Daphnia sinensis]KAI9551207.1 hypothetical protein GHT06_003607 [Daphnia sinensis]KAI9551219.1 hypothetical protein GHT06_006134 [Daphnia sinensis]KAI9565084.1 hypothetical protein GHT06_008838 [Daphnia sinensis]
MDSYSFDFFLTHRGNFDNALEVVGAVLFSLPFQFYTRFVPDDKEFFIEILLSSLLWFPYAPPSDIDFGFHPVSVSDYYYQ